MAETKQDTARRYIGNDLRDAIATVDSATTLLSHARLDEPDELVDKLTAAREALVAAQGAFLDRIARGEQP